MPAFWPVRGRPGLIPRGAWDPEDDYLANDVVTFEDGFYRRKIAGLTAEAPDDDPVNWELLAGRGEKGDPGDPGLDAFPQLVPKPGPGFITVGTSSSVILAADGLVRWRELEVEDPTARVSLGFGVAAILDAVRTLRPQAGAWGTSYPGELRAVASETATKLLVVEYVAA